MSALKKILLTTVAGSTLAFGASGAYAADLATMPVAEPVQTAPAYNDNQFDWNRFYVGIFGAAQDNDAAGFDWEYGAGIDAGMNAQFDFYLLGGEVAISGLTNQNHSRTYGQVLARGGLVVTDNLLFYGAAGYGVDLSAADDQHWLAGGGAEYALTNNVTIRGQYLHGFGTDSATPDMNQVTVGVNYHF